MSCGYKSFTSRNIVFHVYIISRLELNITSGFRTNIRKNRKGLPVSLSYNMWRWRSSKRGSWNVFLFFSFSSTWAHHRHREGVRYHPWLTGSKPRPPITPQQPYSLRRTSGAAVSRPSALPGVGTADERTLEIAPEPTRFDAIQESLVVERAIADVDALCSSDQQQRQRRGRSTPAAVEPNPAAAVPDDGGRHQANSSSASDPKSSSTRSANNAAGAPAVRGVPASAPLPPAATAPSPVVSSCPPSSSVPAAAAGSPKRAWNWSPRVIQK